MRSRAVLAVLVTGMLALAGCTPLPAPAADPTGPPSASPSPSSEPEPELVPKRIVMTSTEIQLFGDDGELASTHTYFDTTTDVVAALTELFGGDPVITTSPSECCHTFAATHYTWGGFKIYDSEQAIEAPAFPEFSVFVSSTESDSVVLETVDGIQVGDSAPAVGAAHPGAEERFVASGVDTQLFSVGGVDKTWSGTTVIISVTLLTDHPDGSISDIRAPACNCGT